MKVIGMTGGVGSGKSLAAQILSQMCGAELLITDLLGHEVMRAGTDGFEKIVERFGKDVVAENGEIDRVKLAEVVFGDEIARTDLNQIVHPAVIRYIDHYIAERKKREGMIVLESAILFEAGCDSFCDEIVYVRVSEKNRRKRLMDNRGYTEKKTSSIMEKQLSQEEFELRCNSVIENDGTVEELKEAIRQWCVQRNIRCKSGGLR